MTLPFKHDLYRVEVCQKSKSKSMKCRMFCDLCVYWAHWWALQNRWTEMLFGGADTRGNKFNIISFESYCLDTYKLQWSVSTTNVNDKFTAANSSLAVFCHSGYNETCKHWPVECQDYWHASVRIICPQPSVIDSNTHAYDWLERLKICQQTVQKIKQHLVELCYTNI